jgi:hypothetical protein
VKPHETEPHTVRNGPHMSGTCCYPSNQAAHGVSTPDIRRPEKNGDGVIFFEEVASALIYSSNKWVPKMLSYNQTQ